MTTSTDMLSQLKNHRPGFTLSRKFYSDPDYYRLDLEHIYYREWLFAGHDCELPTVGSYMTMQVGDYPLIVLRSSNGQIIALHNSCRHRGSRICSAEHGSVKRLVCPYHQWSYDLEGALLRARHMGDDFDTQPYGLKRAHCESVGGYIFVCVAPDPADFAPVRALVEPYLAPHRLAEAKVAFSSTIVENGNWKLVWENNRECYHCAGNHPELLRTFPERPTVSGVMGAATDPVINDHWARCEAAGLPSRFSLSESGQYRATRMPLLDQAVSYTMSGEPGVRRPLCDDVTLPAIGSLLLFHYPTTWNHVLGDHAISFRVLPIGPTQTQLTTKWLVHKDAVEGVDYDLDELTKVWLATNDQDRRIVEENQRGVNSPAFEPGPYSPQDEGGVSQFVDWYCRTMERSLHGGRGNLSRVA